MGSLGVVAVKYNEGFLITSVTMVWVPSVNISISILVAETLLYEYFFIAQTCNMDCGLLTDTQQLYEH